MTSNSVINPSKPPLPRNEQSALQQNSQFLLEWKKIVESKEYQDAKEIALNRLKESTKPEDVHGHVKRLAIIDFLEEFQQMPFEFLSNLEQTATTSRDFLPEDEEEQEEKTNNQ